MDGRPPPAASILLTPPPKAHTEATAAESDPDSIPYPDQKGDRMRLRIRRLCVSALLLLNLSSVYGDGPAGAGNVGSQGAVGGFTGVNFGNNSTHKIDIVSLTNANLLAVRDIMAYYSYVSGGDITMPEVNVGGGNDIADVEVRDVSFDTFYPVNSNLFGFAECPAGSTTNGAPNPYRTCFTQQVWLNLDYNWSMQFTREQLACHELGHTIALRHTSNTASCLLNPDFFSASGLLRPHETEHINTWYG